MNETNQPERRIFGTKEAAEYLGVTPSTIRWHVNEKSDLVPDKRIGGRFMVFSRETLDAFREGREPDPDPDLLPPTLYTTAEAAAYLGIVLDTMRYHLYRVDEGRKLRPDFTIAGRLLFTQETLDAFRAR